MILLFAIWKKGEAHRCDTDQMEKLLIINSRGKIEKNQERSLNTKNVEDLCSHYDEVDE